MCIICVFVCVWCMCVCVCVCVSTFSRMYVRCIVFALRACHLSTYCDPLSSLPSLLPFPRSLSSPYCQLQLRPRQVGVVSTFPHTINGLCPCSRSLSHWGASISPVLARHQVTHLCLTYMPPFPLSMMPSSSLDSHKYKMCMATADIQFIHFLLARQRNVSRRNMERKERRKDGNKARSKEGKNEGRKGVGSSIAGHLQGRMEGRMKEGKEGKGGKKE